MKKYFEHKLNVGDIVIRQDVESNSEHIEKSSGLNYPVIKIKDSVIDFMNIRSLNLNINSNLLPTLDINIDDSDYEQKDSNFIKRNDIITIAIGNLKDQYHNIIKNDYYVTSAENTSSGSYSINAILNVPGLYENINRVFVNKSSIEVLKFIADEVGLGFISNIDDSGDSMNWIQYQTTIDFIEFLQNRMWVSENSRIEIFVDQFANLNVIDVNKALEDSYKTTFVTDVFGDELEEDREFKATNITFDDKDIFAIIDSYTPIQNSGYFARRFPNKLEVINRDISNSTISNDVIESNRDVLKESSTFTSFENDNTYDKYDVAKIKNLYTNYIYDKLKISCNFDNYYPQIFIYLSLNVDIYNISKYQELYNQDKSINLDNYPEEELSLKQKLNDKSGEYLIIGFNISYTYNDNEENMVKQNVLMIKKDEE